MPERELDQRGGSVRLNRFASAAETDLEDIRLYTDRNWSIEQADHYTDARENDFDTLVAMPEIARERRAFDLPVPVHPSARDVIVHRIEADPLVILRVLGGRQNWHAFLALAD